jgi:hypothetical protein
MLMRFTGLLTALGLLLSAMGCTTQSFELTVINHTDRPLTVGVVKDGPPYEKELAGPELWAVNTPLQFLPPWGQVLPPGRTMDSGKISGSFPSGTIAYLRVYRGERTNAELIAMSAPGLDRVDVLLFPGKNEVVIEEEGGKAMSARRLGPAVVPR